MCPHLLEGLTSRWATQAPIKQSHQANARCHGCKIRAVFLRNGVGTPDSISTVKATVSFIDAFMAALITILTDLPKYADSSMHRSHTQHVIKDLSLYTLPVMSFYERKPTNTPCNLQRKIIKGLVQRKGFSRLSNICSLLRNNYIIYIRWF